jgi:ferric-dicitrate binding protein FerR (iron transport regulator)
VRLLAGKLYATVGEATTLIGTPHGRVIAWRTRLTVEVRPRGTDIDVTRGFTHVEGPEGQKQTVQAGAHMFLAARPPGARVKGRD